MPGYLRLGMLGLAAAAWVYGADVRWIRMKSSDFDIYSSAGEKATRETLEHFEQVRSFFTQATHSSVATASDPIRIVLFSSKKDFESYRPTEFAAAFYVPAAERDYIVLGGTGSDAFPVAVHEFVHLVAKRDGLKLPVWLNEGMADFYSTLRSYGGKVIAGEFNEGRYRQLFADKWVPLVTILAVEGDSPYYNEKSKAGSLYSEAWALTHMLILASPYRPGFARLVDEIQAGTPSDQALLKVYGKSLPEIEKDLQAHIRGDITHAAIFPLKLEKGSTEAAVEPAEMFDVKLMLVDLINTRGREDEVGKRLRELSAEDAHRPEPHIELGYLAWRKGRLEEGRKEFAKAVALGSRNPRLLWDYGRMSGGSPSEAIPALQTLLELEPARIDARLFLAGLQLGADHAQDALDTLRPVKKVTSDDAPMFLKITAYAELRVGNTERAQAAANQWKSTAKKESDRDEADRFQTYLASVRSQPRSTAPAVSSAPAVSAALPPDEPQSPPELRRRDAPGVTLPPRAASRPMWPSATGSFVRLDCEGVKATVILETRSGAQKFRIDDPQTILIDGNSGRTVDLSCGPQTPHPVRIDFDPVQDAKSGVLGIVRGIHFTAEETQAK